MSEVIYITTISKWTIILHLNSFPILAHVAYLTLAQYVTTICRAYYITLTRHFISRKIFKHF